MVFSDLGEMAKTRFKIIPYCEVKSVERWIKRRWKANREQWDKEECGRTLTGSKILEWDDVLMSSKFWRG